MHTFMHHKESKPMGLTRLDIENHSRVADVAIDIRDHLEVAGNQAGTPDDLNRL